METVFLGLGVGFAALALAMIVAIIRVETRVRYRRVDADKMEQWITERIGGMVEGTDVSIENTNGHIDIAWSLDARPGIQALVRALERKPTGVELRLVVGPRSELTRSIEQELEAIQKREGVTVKDVAGRPTPTYAVFGDKAALWYEIFSNGDSGDRKYGTAERKSRAVRKLKAHFNQAWQPVFAGSDGTGDPHPSKSISSE